MNYKKLFQMQRALDQHIESNHALQSENVTDKKILALLVELGELANETRCFKFWSVKGPAPREKILEEYVDGIHFILSLGLELGFENSVPASIEASTEEATVQFIKMYETIIDFKNSQTAELYVEMFKEYLQLGQILGFSANDIERAYVEKNEINFHRQNQGY
ncbi:dUTP diphosphatase [Peribacillus tepidiphilus]|uniref:dUTP diphosphatase n=1 Tax=Peribacillus tepidiphilus TaxID=2652445 RepID=UPI00129130FD|nr:dUTP diphosphatase [Peribacillus tepidiphilus]